MVVIEGLDKPWSYMSASILDRELSEFGAMWHGCDWSTHTVLDAPLIQDDSPCAKAYGYDWTWHELQPRDWSPAVQSDGDSIVVTFYTHTIFSPERITRQSDTFVRGRFTFTTESVVIADRPDGPVF